MRSDLYRLAVVHLLGSILLIDYAGGQTVTAYNISTAHTAFQKTDRSNRLNAVV